MVDGIKSIVITVDKLAIIMNKIPNVFFAIVCLKI